MPEHFHFRVDDPVRIVCQGLDVAGTVYTSYNDFDNMVAGVEMYSYRGNYHYWKRGDGGTVYRKVGTEWLKVWPEFEEPCPEHVHPHFKVFLTDETDMWASQVVSQLPKGCKLMGAYLVDTSRAVHICSLTPSYEAWWLYTVPVGGDGDIPENVQEIIDECDADQESVRYFSTNIDWVHDYGQRDDCHWIIQGTGLSDSRHVWHSDGDTFESYNDLIEDMLEEANANHPV